MIFHMRSCKDWNPVIRGGRRECNHWATVCSNSKYTAICVEVVFNAKINSKQFINFCKVYN